MPIFFPHLRRSEPTRHPSRFAQILRSLTIAGVMAVVGVVSAPCFAQTLAHPGFAGNGLNSDAWWQHAVFYEIGPSAPAMGENRAASATSLTDYRAISAKLNALRSLGVDALLVPMPAVPTQASAPDSTLDDFDELMQHASRRGMRVVLSFTTSSSNPELPTLARFWLSRGVAGFRVDTPPGTSPQDVQAVVQTLRKITASAVGQRIVLSNFDATEPDTATPVSGPKSRSAAHRSDRAFDGTSAQLQIDSRLGSANLAGAAGLRTLLAQELDRTQAGPSVLLDFGPAPSQQGAADALAALNKAMAAVVMTTQRAALIDADNNLLLKVDAAPAPAPVAPPAAATPGATFTLAVPPVRPRTPAAPTPQMIAATSLTGWYGQLIALHHGNATLRYGSATMLNFDAQNALVWVSRPPTNSALTPPVVVACNLSSTPVVLSLTSAIRGLNLHGSFLRTLLRSDKGMGGQSLDAVTLEPFDVYIGELRR